MSRGDERKETQDAGDPVSWVVVIQGVCVKDIDRYQSEGMPPGPTRSPNPVSAY